MQTSLAIRKYSLLKRLKEALKPLCVNYIIGEGQDRTPIRAVIFLSLKRFVGKCVSPTFAMPHRGMAALASVGLVVKPWHSASLAWLNTLPASTVQERRRRVEPRHASPNSYQFHEVEIGAILVTIKEKNERQAWKDERAGTSRREGARTGGRTRESTPGIPEW